MEDKKPIPTGTRFGKLEAVEAAGVSPNGDRQWRCRCDCGNEIIALKGSLLKGVTHHCGCSRVVHRAEDLSGRQFGRWTVLARAETRGGQSRFLCRCACGIEKDVARPTLLNGDSTSCGCYRDEVSGTQSLSHGMSSSPEYKAFAHAKDRCLNPNDKAFAHYGGRGITFHPAWVNDFAAFFAEVGLRPSPEHSLDRIDVDGNYEPGNVRWATAIVQANNKRRNRKIAFDGREMNVSQWARETGIPVATLQRRLKMGWSVEQALATPVMTNRRNRKAGTGISRLFQL